MSTIQPIPSHGPSESDDDDYRYEGGHGDKLIDADPRESDDDERGWSDDEEENDEDDD